VFSVREQADSVAWIEWAATTATKPGGAKLCEETVGMYGGSYSGIIQYLVASLPATAQGNLPAAPPHLAAIAPQRAYGDLYRDIVYHGGMVIGSFGLIWSGGTTGFYTAPPAEVPNADAESAWADHLTQNDSIIVNYLNNAYADAVWDDGGLREQNLYTDSSVLPRIANLRVPTLHLAGWFDAFTRGQMLTFERAYDLEQAAPGTRGPNFLVVGPWNHTGTHFINNVSPMIGNLDSKQMLADWYLYWLEGKEAGATAPGWIDSGFGGTGERVRYFRTTSGKVNSSTPADGAWVDSADWPPPEITGVERLYLRSAGDLSSTAPETEDPDRYVYNPSAGTGELLSRWDNAASSQVPMPQWDQRTDEPKGLSYTTTPLADPLTVTGPIALHLFAATAGLPDAAPPSSDWPGAAQAAPPYHDTDFIVKLSDVAPLGEGGAATLVTQGYLRASHRVWDSSQSVSIADEVLAPYHLHTFGALDPPSQGVTAAEATEYVIEIWPTARTFPAGHSLRLDVYSADSPNHLALLKPALNTVFHQTGLESYLAIPVVP
jgi:hypothetical protein